MTIGSLAGSRGLGHHLDHRAAAPGGQSGRWLISGTGPQCAVLQEEETDLRSLHSGLLKVLTPCLWPPVVTSQAFPSGVPTPVPPSCSKRRVCRNTQACDQLPRPPSSFVTLEKILSLSSIQYHQLAASLAGPCWLHSQERKLGPRTAHGDTGQSFRGSLLLSSFSIDPHSCTHTQVTTGPLHLQCYFLPSKPQGMCTHILLGCSGAEMKPLWVSQPEAAPYLFLSDMSPSNAALEG